jgi:hypothetical protein
VSGAWTLADIHNALINPQTTADLAHEWTFRIALVPTIDGRDVLGVMFDTIALLNHVPRECAAVAADFVFDEHWGPLEGTRLSDLPDAYLHTALHELGHGLGLAHNEAGLMVPSGVLFSSAPPDRPFPANIEFSYAPDDERRLRHLPDPWVRPGGEDFGAASARADSGLRVSPLLASVPLGAPVRVDLALDRPGVGELSLKNPDLRGDATGPEGKTRTFRSLLRCVIGAPAADERTGSLTLLRGHEGALFPVPGEYRVRVQAGRYEGAASVSITPAEDAAQAEAAARVLGEPETLLTLALGGDHLPAGLAAVQQALANPVLRPHYAWVEAKRLAAPFGSRRGDAHAAAALLDATTVLSGAERAKAARLRSL